MHKEGIAITGQRKLNQVLAWQASIGVNEKLPHSFGIHYNTFPRKHQIIIFLFFFVKISYFRVVSYTNSFF